VFCYHLARRGFVFGRFCYDVAMLVTIAIFRKKRLSCHNETVTIDGQWLQDDAVKFARWQHVQMKRGATLDVVLMC